MDAAAFYEGEALVVTRLRLEKGADLVEEATEVRSGAERFEPARGTVPRLNAAMVLINGLLTNDKFCMVRLSQVKLRWSRRPYRFRPRKSDYAPADTKLVTTSWLIVPFGE